MNALFAPAIALMNRLRYPKKFALLGAVVGGPGELPRLALEICEHAVAAFIAQRVEFRLEEILVVHLVLSGGLPGATSHGVGFVLRAV